MAEDRPRPKYSGDADLMNRFTTHPCKPGQLERYAAIRAAHLSLAMGISTECPPSVELTTALTKLEESMFWANAAIARRE